MKRKNQPQPPTRHEEPVEFELAKQARDSFDAVAWRASVEGRRRMPRYTPGALDPGLIRFTQEKRSATFLSDIDTKAEVLPAKAPDNSLGFVAAAKVVSRLTFHPGTLLISITADSTRDVDPRTIQIFHWDTEHKRHRALTATGVNIAGGYAWARITQPGVYSAVGMMTPQALGNVGKYPPGAAHTMMLLIIRLFSPTSQWECLGPNHLSCCIYDMAIDPSNSDRIYAAASNGGIWRLDSVAKYPGSTWIPLTDQQPSLVIKCMAVSPANSHVVYYVDDFGQLYRSSDHGNSWSPAGTAYLGDTRRLLAHPTDPDTIYIASDIGFWCSQTAGATWVSNSGQVTLKDGDMTDAAMDPGDASILYVTERIVGLHKSSDGGGSFQLMLPWSSATAPAGTMIKVGLGTLGTDADRTVAVKFDQEVFLNNFGGRGPTLIGGGPWTSLGKQGGTGYGNWCHVIAVDPTDNQIILAGAQTLSRTADAGGSWNTVITYYQPHEDQHRIMFDVTQPGVVYAANDGGMFRSPDHGITWETSDDSLSYDLNVGLVTAEFYTVGVSGDYAVGDAYHQGLLGASSLRTESWSGIQGHSWEFNNVYGDPARPGTYYVFTSSKLFKQLFQSSSSTALSVIGNFTPTAISVDARPGSKILLAADSSGQVWRTTHAEAASPTWKAMAGISLSGDYVVSLVFAPSKLQQAYALTRDGKVFVCADVDSSPTWKAKTTLPSFEGIQLAVSVEDKDHIYAISSSQIYRSIDGGGSWKAVPGKAPYQLPASLSLVSLATGPGGMIYLAAFSGVFNSPDSGQNWFPFSDGLPNVQIEELLWTENDLFAVTQGRGLWHHGNYSILYAPPIAHIPDPGWLASLWLAIYGGDPAPELVREVIGLGPPPLIIAGGAGE